MQFIIIIIFFFFSEAIYLQFISKYKIAFIFIRAIVISGEVCLWKAIKFQKYFNFHLMVFSLYCLLYFCSELICNCVMNGADLKLSCI